MSKHRNLIIIGYGILVWICGCLSSLVGMTIYGGTITLTPISTNTHIPTATGTFTPTITATLFPSIPTNTLTITSTPTITPTNVSKKPSIRISSGYRSFYLECDLEYACAIVGGVAKGEGLVVEFVDIPSDATLVCESKSGSFRVYGVIDLSIAEQFCSTIE